MPLPKLAVAMILFGALLAFAAWALGVVIVDQKAVAVRRGWNLKPAVVAAVDLEPGVTLSDAQLALGSVPEQLLTGSVLTDKSALLGKQVSVRLPKGTLIPRGAVTALERCPLIFSLLTPVTLIMFLGAGLLISAGLGWIAAAVTKNKGGKAVGFILSAMFGGFVIGGFAGVFNYTRIKAGEATVRKGWNLKPVVVAAVDIQAGEAVTFDQISQRSLPEQFVTDAMVTPDRAADVVSQRARYGVQAGDVLLWGFTCPSGR